jgi:maltooligosyltrehalose trehalohydrolase
MDAISETGQATSLRRRRVVGAEPAGSAGPAGQPGPSSNVTLFRVWAPASSTVELVLEDPPWAARVRMTPTGDGYFEVAARAPAGSRYRFGLDDGRAYPDPASRFQPEGPHGPSMVIDPLAFAWTDQRWAGVNPHELVVYEIHVGTFTRAGTWRAAMTHLPDIADLGVNAIEVLPIADFAGRFGWGYDGVDLFAPTHLYGTPDDMRAFVNRAHELGIGVVLDVVYNHFGPDGCWLDRFSPDYLAKSETDWGRAPNFDGPESAHVRAFFEANAAYWIDEFHLDGLRLDATQQIHDRSTPHILRTVAEAARQAAGRRRIWIVGENEPQDTRLLRPAADGGYGLDALWNDDFHHTAMVAATGEREAYYTDYLGSPQEFIACAERGFLYQGQWYSWQKRPRGTPTAGLSPRAFVGFLQNHDQIANSIDGARLHERTSPAIHRALTALLLLGPWTPMLFQGQEFSSSAPFLYFAGHQNELARAVTEGRRNELRQFPSLAAVVDTPAFPVPTDAGTFLGCRLNHDERLTRPDALSLHRSLIALRRSHPAFAAPHAHLVRGAVIGPRAWVLRFVVSGDDPKADRVLLVVNLGDDLEPGVGPEPLLAPGPRPWTLLWSTDDLAVGGSGAGGFEFRTAWRIPAESAWLLG